MEGLNDLCAQGIIHPLHRKLSARGLDFYHKPVKTRSPKAHNGLGNIPLSLPFFLPRFAPTLPGAPSTTKAGLAAWLFRYGAHLRER